MSIENENPDLFKVVTDDSGLKKLLVSYVGEKLQPENDEVTVEMALGTLAEEFPELLLVVAEENFIRGYQQAMTDIDAMENNTKTDKQLSK